MSLFRAEKISFKYESNIDAILEDISFQIDPLSKIGLIGKNGCGKSTLLSLVSGSLTPTGGIIYRKEDLLTGILPQELNLSDRQTVYDFLWEARPELSRLKKRIDNICLNSGPEEMEAFALFNDLGGYLFESRIDKLLSLFNFTGIDPSTLIFSLSAGEKTKLALCRILLIDPDIILLDEPTNHLDIDTLSWLENFMKGLKIPYLIISHDRAFLDNCVEQIWELSNKSITYYGGNFSFYKKEKQDRINRQEKEFEKQQKKIRQLKKAVSDRKSQAENMEKFKLKRSFKKSGGICKRDDGSGKAVRKHMMKTAIAVKSRIERILEKEEARRPFIEKERKLVISDSNLKNPCILRAENLSIAFSQTLLFGNIFLYLDRGRKLAVTGRNGSGKTTLLKILAGRIKSYSGTVRWAPLTKIGYYAQEFENLDLSKTVLEEVLQDENTEESYARTILGCLNIRRDMAYRRIGSLSIGERSKTALAKIITAKPDVLILDEPTNHLEIESREAFEEALKNYNGSMIFVSHDRYFIESVADEIFDMDKER